MQRGQGEAALRRLPRPLGGGAYGWRGSPRASSGRGSTAVARDGWLAAPPRAVLEARRLGRLGRLERASEQSCHRAVREYRGHAARRRAAAGRLQHSARSKLHAAQRAHVAASAPCEQQQRRRVAVAVARSSAVGAPPGDEPGLPLCAPLAATALRGGAARCVGPRRVGRSRVPQQLEQRLEGRAAVSAAHARCVAAAGRRPPLPPAIGPEPITRRHPRGLPNQHAQPSDLEARHQQVRARVGQRPSARHAASWTRSALVPVAQAEARTALCGGGGGGGGSVLVAVTIAPVRPPDLDELPASCDQKLELSHRLGYAHVVPRPLGRPWAARARGRKGREHASDGGLESSLRIASAQHAKAQLAHRGRQPQQ